jgi:hypothetical protein
MLGFFLHHNGRIKNFNPVCSKVAASLISFNGANTIFAGNNYFSSVVLPHSLYRDSKLVAALESLKLIYSTEIEAI